VSAPLITPTPPVAPVLADPLDAARVTAAWAELADASANLDHRLAADLLPALVGALRRLTAPTGPYRARLVEGIAASSGWAGGAIEEGLARFARGYNENSLRAAVVRALGSLETLDRRGQRRATSPRGVLLVTASTIPWAGIESLTWALLARSPCLVRVSQGEPWAVPLFLEALAEEYPPLARTSLAAHWPSADEGANRAACAHPEALVVYGADEAVQAWRALAATRREPPRFIAHGHRMSVAVIGRGSLAPGVADPVADALVREAAIYDRDGCLSPCVAYLEASGAIAPEDFGERVARAQARWAEQWPARAPSDAQASATHQARGTCELAGGRVWASADTAWTVALDHRDPPPAPVGGRFLWLHPFGAGAPDELRARLLAFGPRLSTVGVSGWKARDAELMAAVGPTYATRVCPLPAMQDPPLDRFHDGASELVELVRVRDWEVS
jgi:hypothetical protein